MLAATWRTNFPVKLCVVFIHLTPSQQRGLKFSFPYLTYFLCIRIFSVTKGLYANILFMNERNTHSLMTPRCDENASYTQTIECTHNLNELNNKRFIFGAKWRKVKRKGKGFMKGEFFHLFLDYSCICVPIFWFVNDNENSLQL